MKEIYAERQREREGETESGVGKEMEQLQNFSVYTSLFKICPPEMTFNIILSLFMMENFFSHSERESTDHCSDPILPRSPL